MLGSSWFVITWIGRMANSIRDMSFWESQISTICQLSWKFVFEACGKVTNYLIFFFQSNYVVDHEQYSLWKLYDVRDILVLFLRYWLVYIVLQFKTKSTFCQRKDNIPRVHIITGSIQEKYFLWLCTNKNVELVWWRGRIELVQFLLIFSASSWS